MLGILSNFSLMIACSAFIVNCCRGEGLIVGILLAVVVTVLAGVKNVAALKFYQAASLVVMTRPLFLQGDGVLLGRP